MLFTSQEGVTAVFDALDTGVVVLDRDRRVVAWNAWVADASGVPGDEAAGKTLEEIFPQMRLRRLESAIDEAFEAGASSLLTHTLHRAMFPLRTRAGRTLIHNIAVRPVGQKPFSRCAVQVFDVTVAAERERVLRERQDARYDAVVEGAPDAILTLDSEAVIQFANPAAARQFGYAPEELVGQPLSLLLLSREEWGAAWDAAISGEPLQRPVEVTARRKDGSPTYVEVSASRWSSEARVFVTAILRDVNERRAAEKALRTLNQTLERRVEQRTAERDRMWRLSTDIMLVAELDGTIRAVNPACADLLGAEESALVGRNLLEFTVEADRPKYEEALQSLSRSAQQTLFELRLRRPDGSSRCVQWSAVAPDSLLHAVGRDFTAQREAEQALRDAEDALRQSQKMEAIGQLTGGIAHDFNNLLTGIIGAMEVVKRRIAARRYDETERFIDAAVTSANRAAALTHRLLAFARRQPLDPQAVDVNHLVRGMEDLLRRTLGEQVRLKTQLEDGLWPTLTDEHQLENALLNLAINARDAMPQGGRLTITTRNATHAEVERANRGQQEAIEPGDFVVICVGDTGVGMPPDVLLKVFEPFFTTKPIGQGTGLGLSMIYGFVKQSRGHVRLDSTPGQGTEVRLFLPRFTGEAKSSVAERRKEVLDGSGETVLLVEDDSSVRLLIAEVLRDLGYACVEANDGQAALPMLTSNARVDLMITDVGLPGMNGRELAQMARQHRPDLKVLFVTGYAEHATGREGFLEPGMAMVTKPFALDAMALKIREMITGARV